MNVAKRLQINLLVDQQLLLYPNLNKTYIPIGWIELVSTITPDLAAEFRDAVYGAFTAKKALQLGGWITGTLLLAITLGLSVILVKMARDRFRGDYTLVNINDE
jgi:hypothetical protein